MKNKIQLATWGHLIPEKIEIYDWVTPEIKNLFGSEHGL